MTTQTLPETAAPATAGLQTRVTEVITPQVAQRRMLPINRLRLWVDLTMFVSFALIVLTGIIKMPFLYDPLFEFFQKVKYAHISYVHDIAGAVFGIAVMMHLALSWKRFEWLLGKRSGKR